MLFLFIGHLPAGITVQKGIFYTQSADALRSLDIYAPEDCESCPVVAFVHGGAWKTGDKSNHRAKGIFFAEKGFVFVSINYRTFPHARFPQFIEDVADALRWIHEKIGEYGGDGNRIVLMGHSAGAHIAAMVAYEKAFIFSRGISPEVLKGVILLDGAYDLIELRDSFPALFCRVIRPAFGNDEEQLREASPLYHIRSGYNPPTLIIHTQTPASEPQARKLSKKLTDSGIRAKVYCACNMTHSMINRNLGRPGNPLNKVISSFLEKLPDYILKRSPR